MQSYVDSVMIEVRNVVKLHVQNELANTQRLQSALVIKVFGKNIPFNMIYYEMRRKWSQFG